MTRPSDIRSLRELPFLTVSSTSGTLPDSENLMPLRPNFWSRVSGVEMVEVAVGGKEQALIKFGLGREKGRREEAMSDESKKVLHLKQSC